MTHSPTAAPAVWRAKMFLTGNAAAHLPLTSADRAPGHWQPLIARPAIKSRPAIESRPAILSWNSWLTPVDDSRQQQLDLAFDELIGLPSPHGMRATRSSGDWQAVPQRGLPDALSWSTSLSQAIVETLSGRRSITQLSRWVTESVFRSIDAHARSRSRPVGDRGIERCQSLIVQHPTPDIAEVAVVITQRERSIPMAFRLEARRERWLCTALELSGLTPGASANSARA